MSKDLIDDKYGRFYALPDELAKRGHQVSGICLSYRKRPQGHLAGPAINGELVDWFSVNIGTNFIVGFSRYLQNIGRLNREKKPDIILTCSDAFHIIIGFWMARKLNIPCMADLYDNFESYGLTNLPGILPIFKHAIRNADGVSCVSNALLKYVETEYKPKGVMKLLINGIPTDQFHPMNRNECRRALGLPLNARIIGTAGALNKNRGIDVLFNAAQELIAKDSSIHLALAGPFDSVTKLPAGKNIHYLGKLDYSQVPQMMNALDVGVICNRDSPFGRFCFPQKVYEMLACGIPIIASNVGTMADLLVNNQECLYEPEDQKSLVNAVREQLQRPTYLKVEIPTWGDLAIDLEKLLFLATA